MPLNEKETIDVLNRLANSVDRVMLRPRQLLFRGFLLGLASGLGATVGVAIILALLGIIVRQFGGLPVIGQMFQNLGESVNNIRN